jgi:diguanylate cyclase (GGDEF)-like protein
VEPTVPASADPSGLQSWPWPELHEGDLAQQLQIPARVIDLLDIAYLVVEIDTARILDCNDWAHTRLGYSRAEFLTFTPAAYQADPAHDDAWVAARLQEMRQQRCGSFASSHRDRSGRISQVEVAYRATEFQGRDVAIIAYRDQTALKQAQANLERANFLLSRAEELARIGSWELLHGTGELIWSDQTYRILGLEPQQQRPSQELYFSYVHPSDRERVRHDCRDALASGRAYEQMYRLCLANGSVRVVLEKAQSQLSPSGEPLTSIGTIQDITDYLELQRQLEQANFVDSVTQLPNKAATLRHLHGLLQPPADPQAEPQALGLINFDLDQFQTINDTYGTATGNQLLVDLGQRLRQALTPADWVARIGSDEFLVVCPQPPSAEGLLALAEELQERLSRPWSYGDYIRLRPSLSAGVALCPPGGASEEELLQWANTALMEAKRRGRRQLELYSSSLSERVSERLHLEHELARAIDLGQLRLEFQPQVDRSGAVVGAEALVRWRQADGQEISPAVFIPLAEQTGQIHAIGAWVVQEAFATLARWQQGGLAPSRLVIPRLAINLSALQVQDRKRSISAQILEVMQHYQLDPSALEFEITETAIQDDPEAITEQFDALAAAGCRLAIDDFGTGYSSLEVLHRLPLHTLKIDRCFVDRLSHSEQDRTIIGAMIAMARQLDLTTLAEGVETEEQWAILQQMGCELFQGYLFGKPLNPEAFLAHLGQPILAPPPLPAGGGVGA